MFQRLRQDAPGWLRRLKWRASDEAWHRQWRAIRAAATPWMQAQYESARAKLAGTGSRAGVVIDRAALDGWLTAAAPPGVPFDAVVLPTQALRERFGPGPT